MRDTDGSLAIAVREDTAIDSSMLRFFCAALSAKMQQKSGQCDSPVPSKWQGMLPLERWEKFLSKVLVAYVIDLANVRSVGAHVGAVLTQRLGLRSSSANMS